MDCRRIDQCFLGVGIIISMLATTASAQSRQNPSPMVESTRTHQRLEKSTPQGMRFKLSTGKLFVPDNLNAQRELPLVIHFHGGEWLPEVAASQHARAALISIQLGAGSGVYSRHFQQAGVFFDLLSEAERESGLRFSVVELSAWSAGYGAVRQILQEPAGYARVKAVLLLDGLHTGYVNGQPGPRESQLVEAGLEVFVKFARDATQGRKRMIITHSEIFPGTFASTTECSDYLLAQLELRRTPVLKWGPMGTQQLSEVQQGDLLVLGYAGNSAPDHIDHLHALPEFLQLLSEAD